MAQGAPVEAGGQLMIAFAGGFTPDEVAPTCKGLRHAVDESQALSRNEFLRAAKEIRDALWAQPLPLNGNYCPTVDTIPDLLVALANGWAFNANEGDCLYYVFGDIRAIDRNGQTVGIGTQAPDGAFIHDGRELVSWLDRRWAAMRGPQHLKDWAARHALRIVGGSGT
jgi:hypothetical protein